ncbi:MAG: hypothetical protein KDA25_07430 [Phycisphaerales bacterium]|nr:hypothetical protein [Phycisphaerales bacterium]
MNIDRHDPPRSFTVGFGPPVTMHDCAHIALEPDEQVTFTTPGGGEYDVARKSWGFYATPSLDRRLPSFGLHAMIVRNRDDHHFVVLVERGHDEAFRAYLDAERLTVVARLDRADAVPSACGDAAP